MSNRFDRVKNPLTYLFTRIKDKLKTDPEFIASVGGGAGSGTVDQTIIDGSINAVSGNAVNDGLATKAPLVHTHDDRYYTEAEVDSALSGKAATVHTHSKAQISDFAHTHAKADITDFPALGTAATQNVPAAGNAAAGELVKGDDTRLSDARTPTAHNHDERYYTEAEVDGLVGGKAAAVHTHTKAQITDFPTLGTAASLDVAPTGNATTEQVVKGNDSRLSDTRTPTVHNHTKAEIVDFEHTHNMADITDFPSLGTAATQNVPAAGNASASEVVKGDDTRLSDARTPTAHTHTKAAITDFAHSHTKADVTDFAHTHTKAEITDFAHSHDDLYYTEAEVDSALSGKQATLVSGTNIKTVNGTSLLGSGDITVTGGSGGDLVRTTLSAMKALASPSATVLYFTVDTGKEGVWQWISGSTATADDGIVATSAAGGRFERVLQNKMVFLKWYGTMANWGPTLSNLWTLDYEVYGEQGVTYAITSPVTLTDKNVVFKGNGCAVEFTYTTDLTNMITIQTTPIYQSDTTPWTVEVVDQWNQGATSGSNNLYTNIGIGGNHGSSYLQLALDQTAVLKRGDVVRLFSSGANGEFVAGFQNQILKAEYLVIERIAYDGTDNKTRLAIQGLPAYDYTVNSGNVKLVKMKKTRTLIQDVTFRHMNSESVVGAFQLKALFASVMRDCVFENFQRAVVNIVTTFGAHFDNCVFDNVENGITGGLGFTNNSNAHAGYGFNSNCDQGTTITNCKFSNLRHAFTTGHYTAQTTSTTDPYIMGEPRMITVANSTAKGCSHAWDTHEAGTGILFTNLTAEGCNTAFQVRSRGTSIIGCRANKCTNAIVGVVVNYTTQINLDPCVVDGLEIDQLYTPEGGGAININSTTPWILRNVSMKGGFLQVAGSSTKVTLTNSLIDVNPENGWGTGAGYSWWLEMTGGQINIYNCKLICNNTISNGVIYRASNSKVIIDGLNVDHAHTGPYVANAGSAGQYSGLILDMKNVNYENNGPMAITESVSAISGSTTNFTVLRMQWKTESLTSTVSNRSSKFITNSTNTTAASPYTKHVIDDVIYLKWQGTAATTHSAFEAPAFIGQEMIVHNASANAVTLTLPTLNGVAKALTQHQMARLVATATGAWSYM